MISPAGGLRIYVATRPTDFRKGIDGLALVVQETMGLDPFSGAAFVFRAKRADRIKVLVWDQTGIVLVHKRLEGAKFVWPAVRDGVMTMSRSAGAQLRRSGMPGPTGVLFIPKLCGVRHGRDSCGRVTRRRFCGWRRRDPSA